MSIDLDEMKNRYAQSEIVTDSLGRSITLKRLKMSQQRKVFAMSDNAISRNMLLIAASVTSVHNPNEPQPFMMSFPRTVDEADFVLDLLGEEGFDACRKGYMKVNEIEQSVDEPAA